MTTATTTTTGAESLRSEFLELRRKGASYREIGRTHGLSHERVRQIIGSEAGTSRGDFLVARREADLATALAYLKTNGPTRRSALRAALGLPERQWREIVGKIPRSLLLTETGHSAEAFSEADIKEAVRYAWAAARAADPALTGLSRATYDTVRSASDISGPRIISRYGSWLDACNALGVPHGTIMRPSDSYTTQWDDDDLLAGVTAYIADCMKTDTSITYAGYDRWQRDYPEFASGTLVRNRLNMPWAAVVDAAIEAGSTARTR